MTDEPLMGKATPTEPAADPAAPAVVERPDYVPEKFWNSETNSIDADGAAKAYSELETSFRMKTEDLTEKLRLEMGDEYKATIREELKTEIASEQAASAIKPEEYKMTPPELEGVTVEIDEDSSLMSDWRQIASDMNMTQEQFDKGIAAFAKYEQSMLPKPAEVFSEMGEGGQARTEKADQWLASVLPDNQYEAITSGIRSKEGIEAIESLMLRATSASLISNDSAIAPVLTQADLKAIMAEDGYYQDEAKQAKVAAGFKALFPD